MKNFIFIICLVGLIISCSQSDETKSAKIKAAPDLQIVENSEPKHDGQFWTFSPEPEVVIGVKEGQPEYQLYGVFNAIKLSDGRIMVGNSGTHEIRVYDQNGKFLTSFGRLGKGPGEFAKWSVMQIHRIAPKLIAVLDAGNARVNIFTINGDFKKAVVVEPIEGAGNPQIADVFSGGSWLIWSTVGSARLQGQDGDVIQKDYGFYRLDEGNYSSRLFSIPGGSSYVIQSGGATTYLGLPLTPDPQYLTGSKNGILYSPGSEAKIIRIDSSGVQTHTFLWDIPRQPISEIWDRYKEDYLSDITGERRSLYVNFINRDLPLPEKTPSIEAIKVDRLGYIWVKHFQLPWQEKSIWDVLNSSGKWLGTLELPAGIHVTEIGEDYLLGYTFDSDGVQRIVEYGLNRQ